MNTHHHHHRFLRATLALLALSALQSFRPSALYSQPAVTDEQLQQLLKRFPEADANHDGILTREEAEAYYKTIAPNRAAAKSKSKTKTTPAKNPATSAMDVNGQTTGKKPVPTYADIKYGPYDRNLLDLWLAKPAPAPATAPATALATTNGAAAPQSKIENPKSKIPPPTPLVVFIHGGGFVNGSKAGVSADIINACLKAGVSVMSINYRYMTTAPIQDILHDCARSIQYIRYNAAKYNIDPARIASYGGSAGAGTSLWLAFHPDLADPQNPDPVLRQSSRLVAVAALSTQATYNFYAWESFLGKPGNWTDPRDEKILYGKTADEMKTPEGQKILADVDMLALLDKTAPPVLLYTKYADGPATSRTHYVHHPNHAFAIAKKCKELGVPVIVWNELAEPKGTGNFQDILINFLITNVQKPATPPATATPAAATPPTAALKRTDIEYATAAGESLKLDIAIPAGAGPFPAVIYVHGGGWTRGDKRMGGLPLFEPLEKAGIARFSINYRLAPAHKYPASSDDLDTAIRWVKTHAADYNIDPARIALVGDSAGGHLVALAATRADAATRVAAIVPFYAPTNLERLLAYDKLLPGRDSPSATYLGITTDTPLPEARKLLRDASPAANIRADLPPFLLLHGDSDQLVPVAQSIEFEKKLRAAGVPCELIIIKGGAHGMGGWKRIQPDYPAQVIAWLQKTLSLPRAPRD